MKRSELKVGDELYWAKPGDWKYGHGKKVTVLHVEPYGRTEFGRREIRPEYDGKGNSVHVTIHAPGFSDREDVVRLGDLRGPWDTTRNAVEVRQREARRREDDEARRRNNAVAARNEMTRRAHAAGHRFTVDHSSQNQVVTTVETLGAMLDRIEALMADVDQLSNEIIGLQNGEVPGT